MNQEFVTIDLSQVGTLSHLVTGHHFQNIFFSFKTWVGLLILMLRMQRCYLRILFAYLFVRNEQLIRQLQTLTYVATRRTLNAPMDVNRGAK